MTLFPTDYCKESLCDENAICSYINGFSTCSCKSGFTGNGFECLGKTFCLVCIESKFLISNLPCDADVFSGVIQFFHVVTPQAKTFTVAL